MRISPKRLRQAFSLLDRIGEKLNKVEERFVKIPRGCREKTSAGDMRDGLRNGCRGTVVVGSVARDANGSGGK